MLSFLSPANDGGKSPRALKERGGEDLHRSATAAKEPATGIFEMAVADCKQSEGNLCACTEPLQVCHPGRPRVISAETIFR
jgi:hypothetical protein